MSHSIHRLLPRHFKVLDFVIQGLSAGEIAKALSMERSTVSSIIRSPVFQTELATRRKAINRERDSLQAVEEITARDRAQAILEEALPKAAQKHLDLLGSEDQAIAQRSANAILDKAFGSGGKGPLGQTSSPTSITINADQVQLIQQAISEEKTYST